MSVTIIAKSSTSFGWGKGGNVTSAGWQVTLCDPTRYVSSRSGVGGPACKLLYAYFTFTLLITNRKSHTGFRLVPTSMTSNDLERRNSPFCVFHRIRLLCWRNTSQWLNIWRLIISVNIVPQFQSCTFGHNQPTLQHDLSAIAELFVSSATI